MWDILLPLSGHICEAALRPTELYRRQTNPAAGAADSVHP